MSDSTWIHISRGCMQAADLSPVFSGVACDVECTSNSLSRPHLWETSRFRLILVSHSRNYSVRYQALEHCAKTASTGGWQCNVCSRQTSFCPGGRPSSADARFHTQFKQISQLRGLGLDWRCQTHRSARFPAVRIPNKASDNSGVSGCHQVGATSEMGLPVASLAHLAGASLATIRESRCLSDKQIPDARMERDLSSRLNTIGTVQGQVSVSLDIQPRHVHLQLAVSETRFRPSETGDEYASACAGEKNRHSKIPSTASSNEAYVHLSATEACKWQLCSREHSSVTVLFDTIIDLNVEVTAVPLHFSGNLLCRSLPANCVMLGIDSGCEDVPDDQRPRAVNLVQRQALVLHPAPDPQVVQSFLEDNQSRKQVGLFVLAWQCHVCIARLSFMWMCIAVVPCSWYGVLAGMENRSHIKFARIHRRASRCHCEHAISFSIAPCPPATVPPAPSHNFLPLSSRCSGVKQHSSQPTHHAFGYSAQTPTLLRLCTRAAALQPQCRNSRIRAHKHVDGGGSAHACPAPQYRTKHLIC